MVDIPEESATGSVIEAAHYRQVLGHFPTGVTVITAMGSDGPVGLAVGSFCSVSLDPPLVAFFPDKRSSSWPQIKETGGFCVNILAEEQEEICRIFASKGVDKFAGLGYKMTESGAPRLDDVLAWIDCRIETVHDAGDHEAVIGHVLALDVARNDAPGPLVFYRGGYGRFES